MDLRDVRARQPTLFAPREIRVVLGHVKRGTIYLVPHC